MLSRAMRFAAIGCLAVAMPAAGAAPVRAGTVAVTFDDLPIYPEFPTLAKARTITNALLSGFKRHGWIVTGFDNESQLDGPHRAQRIAVLKSWVDAGMELGNHTYSHASLDTTPPAKYIADIARGDVVTKRLLAKAGRSEHWFRYPYLESGATPQARHQVEEWLGKHGYKVAPVSLQASDWIFAEPYDYALKHGDRAKAQYIRDAYLRHVKGLIAWYKTAAQDVIGRQPAYILLMHASALNAVSIDAIAAILDQADLHPVTLETAMKDPAYTIPESYAGPTGMAWVQRWSLTLHKPLPLASLPKIPPDIQALYDKVEAEDPDSKAALPLPAMNVR